MAEHFENAQGSTAEKLDMFPRFVSRQSLSIFLAKDHIFKQILPIHGAIVECGVFMGAGLFTWAQLSSIYEPANHNRRVIGFDSFEGFPQVGSQDEGAGLIHKTEGGYRFDGKKELEDCAALHDLNRPIGHIPNVELVKGDARQTIPDYVAENQHLVVSLLYLDFDLYEPTKVALEALRERMPKGAVLAFDELNQAQWPGETRAVLECIGIKNLHIQRVPYTPALSYAVLD
ncbi:class I SAM-dependent methyltransferase [Marinifilum sp. JC120]|nr:class I SAM-dependent methyltransferase [Marinifilum sp. JC120]